MVILIDIESFSDIYLQEKEFDVYVSIEYFQIVSLIGLVFSLLCINYIHISSKDTRNTINNI